MARRLGDIPTAPQPGHVSELEGGRREPSLFYLLAIARLTGIPMEILMDDDLGLPKIDRACVENASSEIRTKKKKTTVGKPR